MLDAAPFCSSLPRPNGARGRRLDRAFYVLGAVGYAKGSNKPRAWLLEARARENTAAWESFFAFLGGTPELVVTDGSSPLFNALANQFPRLGEDPPEVRRCEWHLGQNIRSTLPAEVANDPEHPLRAALRNAFVAPSNWTAFEELAAEYAHSTGGFKGLSSWLRRRGSAVAAQISSRSFRGPHSVGPVEQVLQRVQLRIGDRAGAFGNAVRTNRLLRLMTLDLNGRPDEVAGAEIIRRQLLAGGGHASHQRQNDDPKGCRSIRAA